ncbi:hypothetical protein GCM10025789_06470 [Tessaracoccus lubricantis]|uniref:Uncharacterized protein n=1 Tax=Tessaracoccus lubricantis TaxID=545543 RepID=A0ABP9F2S1_9ACTN
MKVAAQPVGAVGAQEPSEHVGELFLVGAVVHPRNTLNFSAKLRDRDATSAVTMASMPTGPRDMSTG